jgi:hypothetical protein
VTGHRKNATASAKIRREEQHTKISIGDQVLLKQHLKAKDQTVFAPKRYTVMSGDRGYFTIRANDGQTLKRNVTHLKRVAPRGDPNATGDEDSDEGTAATSVPFRILHECTRTEIKKQLD